LTAAVAVCATECERIQAVVTLSWSSADGRVDHYMVERDGEQIGRLAPSTTRFESAGLLIGHAYTFGVWAVGGGVDGPTSEVRARTPTPPLVEAQLTGTYRVRETVRRATDLSTLEGIANPVPGSTGTNAWSFDAVCAAQAGACPTDWFSWGPLTNHGVRYDGTFHGRRRSAPKGDAPTTTGDAPGRLARRRDRRPLDRRPLRRLDAGELRLPGRPVVGVLRVEGRARTS
jgi:hypothetical protein